MLRAINSPKSTINLVCNAQHAMNARKPSQYAFRREHARDGNRSAVVMGVCGEGYNAGSSTLEIDPEEAKWGPGNRSSFATM
jgi:hypothetical protein